jgi:hypothetical protein
MFSNTLNKPPYHTLFLLVLLMLLCPTLAVVPVPDASAQEYIWLEAECGLLLEPGITGDDNTASENAYLTTPNQSGTHFEEAGPLIATYHYRLNNVDNKTHYLWARVKYDSYLHNSFWIAFDNSSDFAWRFSDTNLNTWHWQRLGSITGLKAGEHEVYLKLREEQTQVDKLLMTSDAAYTPKGLGQEAENKCHAPSCPDLVITDVQFRPPLPQIGENVSIEITVKNQGDEPTGYFQTEWYKHRTTPPSLGLAGDAYDFANLEPGASFTMVVEHAYDQAGCYTMYAQADTVDTVDECDEENNVFGPLEICVGETPPDSIPSVCDLCDPNLNLGDLVIMKDPYNPNDQYYGWPALVVGKEKGHTTLLPHRIKGNTPSWYEKQAHNTTGQGVPYDSQVRWIGPYDTRNTLIVRDDVIEQYIDCRGLFSLSFGNQGFTGSFRSDQGWVGDIILGSDPTGISLGDNDNMRLQGLLHESDNTVYYPLISSSQFPMAREGEVVIREVQSEFNPAFNTYGLGVVECWNVDVPANSSIVSLSDLFLNTSGQQSRDMGPEAIQSTVPASDSETMKCITTHVRPWPVDYSEAGAFVHYLCSDCGVIRRMDWGNNKYPTDSDYVLAFESDNENTCYVLPQGDRWSDLVDQPYRLAGFSEYADPADTPHNQITIRGVTYRRMRFLAAPVAAFPCQPETKEVRLTVNAEQGGHIASPPGEGAHLYEAGTSVTLQAVADRGHVFDRWILTNVPTGKVNPNDATVTFTVDDNYGFRALFKPIPQLTLTANSGVGGTVAAPPGPGSHTYEPGASVTLTAVAQAGYAFDRWYLTNVPTGKVNPNDAQVTFTMDADYRFYAAFKKITQVTLSVSTNAGGTVASPPGLGQHAYLPGASVTLTAVASQGYVFEKWILTNVPAGKVNPNNARVTFTVDGNYSFHARFKRITVNTLTVAAGTGGTIATPPGPGQHTYQPGESVTLTAVANNGYAFDRWILTNVPGTVNPNTARVTFTMNGNYSFHALFKKVSRVTLTVTAGAGGTVASPPGVGTHSYAPGTRVTLTAVPNAAYTFDRWILTNVPTGKINPSDETVTFTVDSSYRFSATFKPVPTELPNLTDGGLAYRDLHPIAVERGNTVNVSFRLSNRGEAQAQDARGFIKIMFYASKDLDITPTDHALGDEFTWTLPARATRDITVPLKVPASIPSGIYIIGWIIDPDNDIQETNETDNTAFKYGKILYVP